MTKAEAEILFTNGKKIYTKNFKIIWMPTKEVGDVVISAPIKAFKRAAKRNRIKRLIKESIRGLNFSNKNVFIIYKAQEVKTLIEIKEELCKVKI